MDRLLSANGTSGSRWPGGGPAGPGASGGPTEDELTSAFAVVAAVDGTSLMTRKHMLVAFSHAMEEECRTGLDDGHVFGGFQETRFYDQAATTWTALAASARSMYVFADFAENGSTAGGPGQPVEVTAVTGSPLAQEWAVVVDRPRGAMALAARERAGQGQLAEGRRLYDSAWTTDPLVVRKAALLFARAASSAGGHGAESVVEELTVPPRNTRPDHALRERLLDRLLDLIDS